MNFAQLKGGPVKDTQRRMQKQEYQDHCEWLWELPQIDRQDWMSIDDRTVLFNPHFSVGTVCVRGQQPLELRKHHFWEVELLSNLEGTHIGLGVIAGNVNVQAFTDTYVDLIGSDVYGWGVSVKGMFHHCDRKKVYTKPLMPNDRIGVHLDRWNGKIEFYHNGKPLGSPLDETDRESRSLLQEAELYPAIYSSASLTQMRLCRALSYQASLQLNCLLAVKQHALVQQDSISIVDVLSKKLPPGLLDEIDTMFGWLSVAKQKRKPRTMSPSPAFGSRSSPRLKQNLPPVKSHTYPRISICSDVSSVLTV